MLRIENIHKSYGEQVLFDKASLQLQPHERVGLVGRNGSGKSTLFKMILGEIEVDEGCIIVPSGYKIGHVAQHLHFTKPTVLEEGSLGLPPDEIYDTYKVETILSGLGFSEEDMQKPPETFSGGYQVRLNLAKVLVAHPNLLLLDEPTNYLDIVSIRWIIKFLKKWKHELILISHDREFMDSVTTHTALIHRKNIRKLPGDTTKIYAQVAQDEEVYEKTRINQANQRKHIEAFVERFRAQASKASVVQSRVKLLEKLPKLEELEQEQNLDFQFNYARFEAKRMMEIKDLSFGYEPTLPLIIDLSFDINQKDRIAVIGKNGRGKSTLIKLLADELAPNSGTINKHEIARIGYFGQTNIDRLNPDNTVEEEIDNANINLGRTAVRSICGQMIFSGDAAEKKVKVLSGGEKSRVMLGKILATQTNLLLLDEPTNHLDMQSIDSLIDAVDQYDGAAVIVTHSELILRSLATKLIVFQDGNAFEFNGTYDEFLEKIGWREEEEEKIEAAKIKNPKKAERQNRAALINERSQKLTPLKNKLKELEAKIMKLEAEEAATNKKLEEASHNQDSNGIARFSKDAKRLKEEIDECFKQLEKADAEHEKAAKEFEGKI